MLETASAQAQIDDANRSSGAVLSLFLLISVAIYLFSFLVDRPVSGNALSASRPSATSLRRPFACSGNSQYKVPYSYHSEIVVSDLYVRIPMQRIDVPWNELSQKHGTDDANEALRGLLKAVYEKNYTLAAQRIDVNRTIAKYGSITSYVDAFHSSLTRAGDMSVYGRIEDPDAVRFILKPKLNLPYRVFRFRRQSMTYLFDEDNTPTPVEALELEVFRLDAQLKLEVSAQATRQDVAIPLMPQGTPCAPEIVVDLLPAGEVLSEKSSQNIDQPLNFYRNCYLALQSGRYEEYFSCFGAREGDEWMKGFQQLDPDGKAAFVKRELARKYSFLIKGDPLTLLLYRQKNDSSSADLKHQIVLKRGASFEIVSPFISRPLDDVLNSSDFQTNLKKVAVHAEQ